MVLLAGRTEGSSLLFALLIAVAALVAAACYLAFLSASRLGRILGVTANNVLSRLLGVLLAALAVQYVVDGIRAVLKG
jgi:multiple antibiotic resistance protein